jgi:hypothetical protein
LPNKLYGHKGAVSKPAIELRVAFELTSPYPATQ